MKTTFLTLLVLVAAAHANVKLVSMALRCDRIVRAFDAVVHSRAHAGIAKQGRAAVQQQLRVQQQHAIFASDPKSAADC